jgi:hypothetical protein
LLFVTHADIEIGFSPPALTVSEGDGVVSAVTVGILNGGITEQRVYFIFFFTPGSKI